MSYSRAVWYKGIKFDSTKERNRYQELELLEYAGEIQSLEVHPKFHLQAGFTCPHTGKKIQALTWTGDFRYVQNGVVTVEDVKGTTRNGKILITEASKVRMKIAQYQNRDVFFKVVGM